MPVVDLRALLCVGNLERNFQGTDAFIFKKIGRAGEDRVLLLAVIEPAQHKPIRIGVRMDLTHFTHHQGLGVPGQPADLGLLPAAGHGQADVVDLFDLEAGYGELVSQLLDNDAVQVDKIFKP